MRVRAMSATGVVVCAAAGLVALPAGVAAAAATCAPSVGFDANGDGIDDTAVGAPGKDLGSVSKPIVDAGSVTIVYGKADGTFGTSSQQLTQASLGSGANDKNDRFGASVAIGDLNADGCKDLAIGVPGEKGYGRVIVVFGSATGLTGRSQAFNQNTTGVPGTNRAGDQFGEAVAVTGTGSGAFLWVGVPGKDRLGVPGVGEIMRFRAGAAGGRLPMTGVRYYFQGSTGVPGTPESGDEFGKILSGSAHSLVVGVPREDVKPSGGANRVDAGVVYVFTNAWTSFAQEGASGHSEAGDRFGASVSQIASCSNPAQDAIVVGAPGEDLAGPIPDGGVVTVVDQPAGTSQPFFQGDGVVPGPPQEGNSFGLRVLGAGHLLLAAAPYEEVGLVKNAGAVFQAILGCSATNVPEVQAGKSNTFSLESADVFGDATNGDRFGAEMGFFVAHEGGPISLLVGTPLLSDGSILDAGRVTVLPVQTDGLFVGLNSFSFGQSDAWVAGVPRENDQFGSAIATNAS